MTAQEASPDGQRQGEQYSGENQHGESLPPIPPDPQAYWKALTHLDGTHHVFPGDQTSHLEEAQQIGWSPHTIKTYWGWSPYMNRWEDFNRFTQDYHNIWNELGMGEGGEAGGFAAPTVEQDWHFGRVANQLWTPGTWGKGLWLNGEVITWNTGTRSLNAGTPHHAQMAKAMGVPWDRFLNGIKDGSITLLQVDPEGVTTDCLHGKPVPPEVFQADPRLKPASGGEDWHFASQEIAPPPDPRGRWSGLLLHDGTLHVWPAYTKDDEHNSHVGYMHHAGITPDQVKSYLSWDGDTEPRWKNFDLYAATYQNLYDDPEAPEWYFGKVASDLPTLPEPHPDYRLVNEPVELHELQPWKPGQYGKFLGFPDGYVKVWANQPNARWHDDPEEAPNGWPSHFEVAKALGRPYEYDDDDGFGNDLVAGHTFGFISPEGEITHLDASHGSPVNPQHVQSVMRQYPTTTYDPDPELWRFAKTATTPIRWEWVGRPGYEADHSFVYVPGSRTAYIGDSDQHHSDIHRYLDEQEVERGLGRNEGAIYDGGFEWYNTGAITPQERAEVYESARQNFDPSLPPVANSSYAIPVGEWHFGAALPEELPPVLYHWTEARNAPWIADEGLNTEGVYLTVDDDPNQLNADIPTLEIPFRVSVDTSLLDPALFGQFGSHGYPGPVDKNLRNHGNIFYNGAIPPSAIVDMRKFKRVPEPEFEFAL